MTEVDHREEDDQQYYCHERPGDDDFRISFSDLTSHYNDRSE